MSRDTSRKLPFVILALLLLAAVGLTIRWWTYGRFHESTDNAYVRADVSYLTPRVGGEVVQLLVKNNQPVKAGDLLLKIEDADYQARVAQAKAQVAMREAALLTNRQDDSSLQAQVAEAEAALQAAKAEESRLQLEMQRAKALVQDGVATKQRLDNATAAWQSAAAQSRRAESGIAAARARQGGVGTGREQLAAELESARAALKLAEIDLAATEIRAPINGVVGDLAARLGSRVAAGSRLMAIVPLDAVFVEANFKETQLAAMKVGQQAEIELDAYPGLKLEGVIQSLSPASGAEFALLPPDNATGNFNKIVQRVPVKILLNQANTDGKLRPGMSAEVVVETR
ncbi:MAG TPA: HlyD family secretion protein [Fluviicoccus sp.]|nr:HlyD family secretion protein [Fluviicoccus sp.]